MYVTHMYVPSTHATNFLGFASGLSGGVFQQLIHFSAKNACAWRDVCFRSLSCINLSDTHLVYKERGNGQGYVYIVEHTVEYAHSSCTPKRPNINFHWVLGSRFIPWFLASLTAVEATIGLHLHTSFVCPYDILEGSPEILSNPF